MWTGLGDGDDESKEGTYYRQIRRGNLISLDDWFNTDKGMKLKEEYLPYEWELLEYEGHIYGVRNIEEQGISYKLVLTGDEHSDKVQDNMNITKLCDYLESIVSNSASDNKIYMDWKITDGDNAGYSLLGYIKLSEGLYMTPEGTVVNVWEDEAFCRLWACLAALRKDDRLIYDQNEELAKCYEGSIQLHLGVVMELIWMKLICIWRMAVRYLFVVLILEYRILIKWKMMFMG